MKKSLEIISFRDLTKKILDNMIKYVDKNDKTLLKGLTKRKDKLNEIKQKYKYNGIYFMKKPIEEIIEKYYSSNSKSHEPKIVQIIKAKPYGLALEPEKEISKKFLSVMIDSKSEEAFHFIKNNLGLEKEITDLYLKKKC